MASLIEAPRWTREQLEAGRSRAIEIFRQTRMEEPLEEYLEVFDEYQGRVEELLETTVDLSTLDDNALEVLTDPNLREAFRYLAGPPISLDDLKTLADVKSITPRQLRANPDFARRLVETVRIGLDRRRFPWVTEGREPTEAERGAAVLASAALIATQRVATTRRNVGKQEQEQLVRTALQPHLREVATRRINTLAEAPGPGEFCMESLFGTRKADIVIGLWDRRTMPLECKVSNSETNSIKRLKNDAAIKAETWRHEFGDLQVVPSAVLSGVYKLRHLEEVQNRGLTLFWAHALQGLLDWIERTRPGH
jgi:hypothetical protein